MLRIKASVGSNTSKRVSAQRASSAGKTKILWRGLRVVGWSLIVWCGVAWLAAHALSVRTGAARADALVVLSGSADYVERARWAARLFKQQSAPKIILTNDHTQSGWSTEQQRNPLFVERAVEELQRAGVPSEGIEVLELPLGASSTYKEAMSVRQYAAQRNLRSILVVTSDYHSRRALWTWQRVFENTDVKINLDAPPPEQQTPPRATWWLHSSGWRMVAGEYLKLAYYWLRYH